MNSSMMNPRPLSLNILILFYLIATTLAIWRAISLQTLDMFSIASILVLIGILKPMSWSYLVLKIYVILQTLAVVAYGVVAMIAWQVTPDKLADSLNALPIPASLGVTLLISWLTLQYVIIFKSSTKSYLSQ